MKSITTFAQRIAAATVALLLAGMLAACGSTTSTAVAPSSQAAVSTAAVATAVPAATSAPAATDAPAATAAAGTSATSAPAATAEAAATDATAEAGTSATSGDRTFAIVSDKSEASYTVQETFLQQNLPFEAVGKTTAVTGTFQFNAAGQPTGQVTQIQVDLRTLKSDSDRRDNAIRERWLESNTYPYATFVSTEVQGVPASYTEGQDVSFKLVGNMTIHEVTKPVTFDVTGKLAGNTVTGTATTQFKISDFFEVPSVAGFVSLQDGVKLTVNFTAQEQGA